MPKNTTLTSIMLVRPLTKYPITQLGGDPRLVFFDALGNEVQEINISNMDSEGIMKTLEEKGFKQKQQQIKDSEL